MPSIRKVPLILLATILPLCGAIAETVTLDTTVSVGNAYLVNGKPKGFVVDLITEAFARTGRQVDIRFLPWARCMEEVRNGHADGIFLAYHTAEREAYFDFSEEPLFYQEEHIFVRKGDPFRFTGDLAQLRDKRIGVLNQTAHGQLYDQAVAEGRLPHIEAANSYENLMRMLMGGRIDVVLASADGLAEPIKEFGFTEVILESGPPIESNPSFLAFTRARDMSILRAEFDASIRALRKDGTLDKLRARNSEMN